MKMREIKLKKKVLKMKKSFISFENVLGLVFALFILFEFKFESNIRNMMNSHAGIILSFVVLILLFIYMNPIVGLLFLIVIYENIKTNAMFNHSTEANKQNILNKLNLANDQFKNSKDNVEYSVIDKMAPIIKKPESTNANFIPHINDTIPFNDV